MVSRIAALMLCCIAVPAFGQDTTAAPSQDTTAAPSAPALPFRRGQWAAHFVLGSFTGVGVSLFRSPKRAIVLQLDVFARHTETTNDGGGTPFEAVSSAAGGSARLGWRGFRAGSGRVTPYYTLGPLFGFSHSYGSNNDDSAESNAWSLGVFADLGALYRVNEWLALGAAGNVDVRYSWSTARSSAGGEASQWEIAFSGVRVTAGLTLMF